MKTISEIKTYQNNFVIWSDETETPITIVDDDFVDDEFIPIKEHEAREILSDKFNITDDAADKVVQYLHMHEWIINDNEVHVWLVYTYEAFRADEKGKRWMTHRPQDTVDYKHSIEDSGVIKLPEGYEYDEDSMQFSHNGRDCELVTEDDGTLELVSADGIMEIKVY